MKTMRAWVYDPDRRPEADFHLYLEERPVPDPEPGDVLLRVRKVSVCGTDEMLFSGHLKRALPGVIPGHEFCGEIVAAGTAVQGFETGQIVAGESHYRVPASSSEGVIGLWPPRLANGTPGRMVHGAYAEYLTIPVECAHPIPRELSEGDFWPSLFEPAGNDFLVARIVRDAIRGEHVGVFGCGPHGLYAQVFLSDFGVGRIVAFEIDPERRRMARELGCAAEILDSRMDGLEDAVRSGTGGELFDVTLDMVGKGGAAFEQACSLTRPGGVVVLFGLFERDVEIAGRKANDLIFERARLPFEHEGKPLHLIAVTGREGVWADLIETVAASPEIQRRLMLPVERIGSLDGLGDEVARRPGGVRKRAFTAFNNGTGG